MAGGGALKRVFSRLFSISSTRTARVAEMGVWYDGLWVWDLAWRRPFFD